MVDSDDEPLLKIGLRSDGYKTPSECSHSVGQASEASGIPPFPPLPPPAPQKLDLPEFLRNDRATLEEPRLPADYVTEQCLDLRLRPKMPWEVGQNSLVFGTAAPCSFLEATRVGAQEFFLQASFSGSRAPRCDAAEEFTAVRAYYACRIKSPDEARKQALLRLKILVIAEPSASRLGEMVWDAASRLDGEEEIMVIISDSVAGKATATLIKYMASLWRYAKWVRANKVGTPLRPTETIIWRFLSHLRESGVGATAGSTMLVSLTFLYRTAQVKEPSLDFLMS